MTSKHYMTKTIVLGVPQHDEIKQIEFIKLLGENFTVEDVDPGLKPVSYANIECICKKYDGEHDLMFAYNDATMRQHGTLFIGKWNNGIVK